AVPVCRDHARGRFYKAGRGPDHHGTLRGSRWPGRQRTGRCLGKGEAMKALIYGALVLAIVPLQSTLWHAVSIGGVRPDLGLIAACLVGFLGGELDGLLLGCVLGLSQDIFSAGDLWLNMVTKGGAGFLTG